jgi:cellulose biosynthesis protein BcsQ
MDQFKNIIGLTSPSGGTGVTTVALNLSALLSSRGITACLVDLSLNKTATKYHFPTAGPPATIISWLDINCCDRAVSELVLHGLQGVHIVPAPALKEQWSLITTDLISFLFSCLAKKYDVVIVDIGHTINQDVFTVLKPVLVTTTEDATLDILRDSFKNQYSNLKSPTLVVNKCSRIKIMQGKKVLSLLGIQPICYLPHKSHLIEKAYINRVRTFPVALPKGRPLIKPLDKLLNKLLDKSKLKTAKRLPQTAWYKKSRNNGQAEVAVTSSVNQAISEAKKANRPLVIVDTSYNNPSLAMGFGIPPEKTWAHDWRAGLTVVPHKIEKGVDIYTLDPQIKGFDERDSHLLKDLLATLSSRYKTVIVLQDAKEEPS